MPHIKPGWISSSNAHTLTHETRIEKHAARSALKERADKHLTAQPVGNQTDDQDPDDSAGKI
jgi:hypothetical protein